LTGGCSTCSDVQQPEYPNACAEDTDAQCFGLTPGEWDPSIQIDSDLYNC
jgi:hypothetical protein